MDFEHVEHGDLSSTVLQSNNRTDQPPPAYGATGTRRNPFGSNYPTMMERIDIDLTVCKAEITSLETQATQQAVRMERLQQELRIAKEDREKMTETIDELRSQVLELTSKIETGAASLKSLSDVCTFRAADFHAMISDIRQQQRDSTTSSSIEIAPPPPTVADRRLNASVQPSAAHEQRDTPSAPSQPVPVVPQPSSPDQSFDRDFCDTGVQITSSRRVEPPLHLEDRMGSLFQPQRPAARF